MEKQLELWTFFFGIKPVFLLFFFRNKTVQQSIYQLKIGPLLWEKKEKTLQQLLKVWMEYDEAE